MIIKNFEKEKEVGMSSLWILLIVLGLSTSVATTTSLRSSTVPEVTSVVEAQDVTPADPHHRRLWEVTLSNAVDFNCKIGEYPVCCQVMGNNTSLYTPKKRDAATTTKEHGHNRVCKRSRVYQPSPYELQHMKMAQELVAISDYNNRRDKLYSMIKEDLDDSIKWLERVDYHMRHANEVTTGVQIDPLDLRYLSRFNNTIDCDGTIHNWLEWIEPITIHARHPISMIENCHPPHMKNLRKEVGSKIKVHTAHINIVDHIILESNRDYHLKKLWHRYTKDVQPKRFFFDAGTSYFYSSLSWFTCAYAQKNIDFDHLYAWEVNALDHSKYYTHVPPKVIPYLHLINAPVSAQIDDGLSVMRMIDQIASEEDFVSFKLDIDTPEVEIPIFLDIVRNPERSAKVDELFFELHFNCEIMKECGWGTHSIPEEFHGFKLDRYSALKAFQDIRFKGVRSHFWP